VRSLSRPSASSPASSRTDCFFPHAPPTPTERSSARLRSSFPTIAAFEEAEEAFIEAFVASWDRKERKDGEEREEQAKSEQEVKDEGGEDE
jgi:hypothetical protein